MAKVNLNKDPLDEKAVGKTIYLPPVMWAWLEALAKPVRGTITQQAFLMLKEKYHEGLSK